VVVSVVSGNQWRRCLVADAYAGDDDDDDDDVITRMRPYWIMANAAR
jgi:hypothetical protein